MAKLRDKISVSMVRMINMNPEGKDRVVKKVKFYAKLGPYMLKRDFERVDYDANGVPLEIHKRKGTEPEKLVFIIHGGVFIMGLFNTYRNLHSVYSDAANGAAVANIDYRTAPDHKYPAAHDDVMTGWEFLLGLGYKPCDIVLVGDSSGGNLALSLLLKLRDQGRPLPAAAVLISPWTDLMATGASYKSNYNRDAFFGRKGSVLDDEKIRQLLASGVYAYAADADRSDPYLSPVLGLYHDMPPILMTAGSHEMVLDDTLAVAEKIKAAGGNVKVIIGEGMFHVYPLFYKFSPTAKETFNEILSFLKEHTS